MASKFNLTAQLVVQAPTQANLKQTITAINKQLKGIKSVQVLNAKQTTASSNSAINSLKKVGNQATKTGQKVGFLSSQVQKFRRQLGRRLPDAAAFTLVNGLITSITSNLFGAVGAAVKFEREMARVQQVTGGTADQISVLSDAIRQTSASLGVSSRELTNVARVFSQTGLSAKDVKTALKAVAQTDLAPTFDSVSATAEGSIAILNQFGVTADELEDKLGSINAVAGQFAVESGDIIEAVKRGGAAFKSAGGSFEEFAALVTTVRQTTREGAAQIGTSFKTIFTRLQRPKTITFLKELGVNLTDVNGKFVGGFEAIKRLSQAFGDFEEGDLRLSAIADELGGLRQITRLLPLIQQGAVTEKAYAAAINGRTSVAEQAAIAQDTQENKNKQLAASFENLVNVFVGGNEGIKSGTDILIATVQGLQRNVENLFAVFSPLTNAFSFYAQKAEEATKANKALAESFATLGSGLGVLAGASFLGGGPSFAGGLFGGEGGQKRQKRNRAYQARVSSALQYKATMGGPSKGIFGGLKDFGRDTAAAGKQFFGGKTNASAAAAVTEKFTDALGGAVVGIAAFNILATVVGRTVKAQNAYNEALEKGSAVQIGAAAVELQTQKDLDALGNVVSGTAGAIAGAFLGPVGGQLVGALAGIVAEGIAASGVLNDFVKGARDVLGSLGIFGIQTTRRLAEIAREAQGARDLTKRFSEKDEDGNFANEVGTSDLFTLRRQRDVARGKSFKTRQQMSSNERELFDEANAGIKAGEDRLISDALNSEAAQEILANGGNYADVLATLDAETRKYIQRQIGVNRFQQAFEKEQKSLQERLLAEISTAGQERLRLELELNEITRKRLSREFEAAEIIAEFGGPEFTAEQRRANLVGQLNTTSAKGISKLTTGSPEELQARAEEIGTALQKVDENIRSAKESGPGSEGDVKELEKRRKELVRLSEQQYDITKKLIDERKRELEQIKAKNALEQQGLEAAITGDFEKFFKNQAAQGARGALALGDTSLASQFGSGALGDAFKSLKDLQNQGVNSFLGQSIGGTNGLLNTSAAAALQAVGINDPNAAGVLSGQTAEQAGINAEIRGLASTLPATAQAQGDAANIQLEAANKQYDAAIVAARESGASEAQISARTAYRATGGSIFKPRGTDTVPAMLTPGEFVVNAKAVARGNNLQLLRKMNGGDGGTVSPGGTSYFSGGGKQQNSVSSSSDMSSIVNGLTTAVANFSTAVDKLATTTVQHTVAPVTVNVNLNGQALRGMRDDIQEAIMASVSEKIGSMKVNTQGNVEENKSQLPSFA